MMDSKKKQCPACGEGASPWIRSRDHNRQVSSQEFTYFLCKGCGLIFISSIPDNLGEYYQDDYFEIPASLDILLVEASEQIYKLDLIRAYVREGRLLDIGSSYGSFAYLASESGIDVECIEGNPMCCEYLEQVLGITAHQSLEPGKKIADLGKFDVITLWHVLEHLPGAWEMLDIVSEHLNEDGILVIAAPNPAAFQFAIFKSFWAHLDAPRHVQLIPISLIENRLQGHQMKLLLQTHTDQGSLGWNIFGWQKSLSNIFRLRDRTVLTRILGRIASIGATLIER
ncbi:class I SAM-dependent methyltransferase, partial [bacterium]|nr:class I SAM-dependent methyltransferase [bacterium]